MKKQKLDENVWYIDNFLSPEECEYHIKQSEQKGYEFAKVNLNGKQTRMDSVRNNERVLFKDDEMATVLWSRLAPFILADSDKIPIGLNEMWRYYKYKPGERFKLHRDGKYARNTEEYSTLTLLVYLNDDFEGGATGFKRKYDIHPKTGTAILFKHEVLHEGKPVINGIKYVLRTDVMFRLK